VEFLGRVGGFIMAPLYYLISAVLVGFHQVWGGIFGPTSGISWALSIICLTLVVRAALIPLFVKQIKSSRNMQLLQPKVKELQAKYGHDRERLAQETMNLYRETKTNPLASCLPLIVQMPIFIALFRLLDLAAKKDQGHGLLTPALAKNFGHAPLFGGQISSSFVNNDGSTAIKFVAAFLVLMMTATTFLTQRQLMSKNMPADALSGPFAQQQKLLLYVLPVVFGVSGIFFPIGVLLYWTTSNLWTMCQQFYVIRNNPAPNTEAFRDKQHRDEEKRKRKGAGPVDTVVTGTTEDTPVEPPRPVQRQQPRKQTRSQRKRSGGKPAGSANGSPTPSDSPASTPADDPPSDDKPHETPKR
jgi:YidC/Oxa1 family membrane protein insertase